MIKPWLLIALVTAFLVPMVSVSEAKSDKPKATRVYGLIDRLIKDGFVAGAQVVVGEADSPLVAKSFGVRDVNRGNLVNDDTRFCIGSCSKMFAGAVLVSLASEKTVDLDAPIDRWLKGFSAPKLVGGGVAGRAPNLRELLCHRAGIYSQRNRMTESQTRWIRDFKLSLADSVAGIAAEPLNVEPGKEFAYSGAGYCVLGRVAEVASGKRFDELLAMHVGRPLSLSRTTYFPPVEDDNVAAGHTLQDGKLTVVERTPHLLRKQHKLALIGGSIYAPGREAAKFAQMLLHKGKAKHREVLSPGEWKEMSTLHSPRPSGGYGFGLLVSIDAKTGEVQTVSHGGALFGSFSHITVDYRTRRFGVVNYTGRRSREIGRSLQRWVRSKRP